MYPVVYPMTEAADAMKMASSEGISLKEAWAKVKAARPDAEPEEVEFKAPRWDSKREAW